MTEINLTHAVAFHRPYFYSPSRFVSTENNQGISSFHDLFQPGFEVGKRSSFPILRQRPFACAAQTRVSSEPAAKKAKLAETKINFLASCLSRSLNSIDTAPAAVTPKLL